MPCHHTATPMSRQGNLVSGQVRFSVGSEEIICNPGDSWCVAGDKEHGAEALQDSVLVEVFSPVTIIRLSNVFCCQRDP